MGRRVKSFNQGSAKKQRGYVHREHRSKKGRDEGYKNKRTKRVIDREYEEKRERKYMKKLKHNLIEE